MVRAAQGGEQQFSDSTPIARAPTSLSSLGTRPAEPRGVYGEIGTPTNLVNIS